MEYESYVDYYNVPLTDAQIRFKRDKGNSLKMYVAWWTIPKVYLNPSEIN
jgi:glutaredoxin-related protein